VLNIVRFWILLSTLLVASGWILSAIHQLNRAGYGIVFVVAVGCAGYWLQKKKWCSLQNIKPSAHKLRRRFKRAAPVCFFALAFLSVLGGALYIPSNPDSNQYRIPRVLHWLGEQQWHWIHTADLRMNIAGCGFEWLSAPLILFTRTDRFIFLINWVSYLMLPGLIFSVFTRLQVRPRVAWWWMWILSSGWCFIMQAGSTVNDCFSVVYALAAVDFALRARAGGRASDFWLSMLAAALVTGSKQTAIPLAVLWFVAACPSIWPLFTRPIATTVVIVISLLISAVPLVIFNLQHFGTWDGVSKTFAYGKGHLSFSLLITVGNIFFITFQNLKPPFFPFANIWNAEVQRFLHTSLGAHFTAFDQFGWMSWGVAESNAGIGLGICLLTLISVWAARRCRPALIVGGANRLLWLLRWTPLALFVLFAAKVGTFQNARLMAPYYVFLFPLLLARPGHENLVRRSWWQRLGLSVMLIAVVLLAVSRDRPLLLSQISFNWFQSKYPHSKLVSVMRASYSSAPSIAEQRDCLREGLPPNEQVVGYATTIGDAEPGLWLPFGRRRVERVLPDDTSGQLQSRGIHYVAVDDLALNDADETIEQWMARYDGVLVSQWKFTGDPHAPPHPFYLVRLREIHADAANH
jgi:hypothetical protein